MRPTPFDPTLVVHTHRKTILSELLVNRLPKSITVFESYRWEKEMIPLACLNSKMILLMVTPTSCSINSMTDYIDIMKTYGEKTIALVSNNSEKGIKFTQKELSDIIKLFGSYNINTYTSLNHLASSVRGRVHLKINKNSEYKRCAHQYSEQPGS